MSWKASAWAKEQRLGSPAAKSILLCLADYADPDKGECWPSQTQLASDAEVSERTAREWLQRLEEWGLIARARRSRANGARASDMIVLQLGARVRDGADRCREIKDADAASGDDLPAEIAGRTYRQPDAEPSGNEAQPTGNQCRAYKDEPSIEPPSGTSQPARQGARESGEDGLPEESQKSIETAFWRVVKDWPRFAGMPKEPAKRAWLKLSAEDRALAEARLPGWMAMLKANRRDHVPAPATYFGEKLWEAVPDPAEAAKPVAVEAAPWGPMWQAARLKQLVTGPKVPPTALTRFEVMMVEEGRASADALRRQKQVMSGWPQVNSMHERAKARQGVTVATTLEPLAAMMVAVPVGSETFLAWKDEHEKRGWPWLPDPGRQPVVYFPAGGPEALEAFEAAVRGNGNDASRLEAAE